MANSPFQQRESRAVAQFLADNSIQLEFDKYFLFVVFICM